ncbi:hypothetical protein [Anaerotignum sp.]|uniref:hypothetical protein n=1 Tax=Anaerotignum sp. TaxID=2039241 RepID=UPI0028A1DE56|nr:hypothetical protein [Anaerotignum sp.]
MSEIYRNLSDVQTGTVKQHFLESELTSDEVRELEMIRQEILAEYRGKNILSFHRWKRRLMRQNSICSLYGYHRTQKCLYEANQLNR